MAEEDPRGSRGEGGLIPIVLPMGAPFIDSAILERILVTRMAYGYSPPVVDPEALPKNIRGRIQAWDEGRVEVRIKKYRGAIRFDETKDEWPGDWWNEDRAYDPSLFK